MKNYASRSTELGVKSITGFGKVLPKSRNHSVYGKIWEKIRKRKKIDFVTSYEKLEREQF